MDSQRKYIETLIELLRRWIDAYVVKEPTGYMVAGVIHHGLDAAVDAVVLRFPPPPYPPKWDFAVPVVVRIAVVMLLESSNEESLLLY